MVVWVGVVGKFESYRNCRLTNNLPPLESYASFLIDGGLDLYKSSSFARQCILFPPVLKQDAVENGLPTVGQRNSLLSRSHLRSVR